jgi:pyrimidine operon attenuation protein/uracil phosphoribosyltransferase
MPNLMPTPILSPNQSKVPQLDAEALSNTLLQRVVNGLSDYENIAIVGIHSGGAWLAERIAAAMGLEQRLGLIDISFYRDDFVQRGLHPVVKSTHIPFDVNGATILLVDDVLQTGRTIRAAMNELFDYGRPANIMLAVLVDRGGRELPVAAGYVAQTLHLKPCQALHLHRAEDGQLTFTIDEAGDHE